MEARRVQQHPLLLTIASTPKASTVKMSTADNETKVEETKPEVCFPPSPPPHGHHVRRCSSHVFVCRSCPTQGAIPQMATCPVVFCMFFLPWSHLLTSPRALPCLQETKPTTSAVFSMFGGGAKKEKKDDEDRGETSGSAKAQREAAAAAAAEGKGGDEVSSSCCLLSPIAFAAGTWSLSRRPGRIAARCGRNMR